MATVITRFKVEGSEQYNQKIKNAGKSLNDMKRQGDGVSGTLSKLGSSLGVNISSLAKMGTAVGAVAGALKVAKDAFFATEQGIDAWGRTTEAAKGIYSSFLQTLNTGDFGSFFSNMDGIISRAKEAYNAIDALGTMTAFSDVDLQKIQTERLGLQLKIKQGKANGMSGADLKALQDQLMGKDEELEKIAKEKAELAATAYNAKLKEIVANATGGNYDPAMAHKYADTWEGFKGISADVIKQKQKELDSLIKKVGSTNFDLYKTRHANGSLMYQNDEAEKARVLELELKTIKAIAANEAAIVEAKQLQVKAEQANQQALTTRLNSQKYLAEGKSGTNTTTVNTVGGIKPISVKLNGLEQASASAQAMLPGVSVIEEMNRSAFDTNSIDSWNKKLKEAVDILNTLTIGSAEFAAQQEVIAGIQQKLNVATGKTNETAAQGSTQFSQAAQAVSALGGAMASIEDPASKVMGIIAQSIAQVALTFASSLKGTVSPWDWIAGAAAGAATMVATIASIKSATEYHAAGGFVGMGRGTDVVPAMLTPGELVLNRAQQSNLASNLRDSSWSKSMVLETRLDGEAIRVAVKNSNARRGIKN